MQKCQLHKISQPHCPHLGFPQVQAKVKIDHSTRSASEMVRKVANHYDFFCIPLPDVSPDRPVYQELSPTCAPGGVVGPSGHIRGTAEDAVFENS